MCIYRFLKLETQQRSQVDLNMLAQMEVTLYKCCCCHMSTDQLWHVVEDTKMEVNTGHSKPIFPCASSPT